LSVVSQNIPVLLGLAAAADACMFQYWRGNSFFLLAQTDSTPPPDTDWPPLHEKERERVQSTLIAAIGVKSWFRAISLGHRRRIDFLPGGI